MLPCGKSPRASHDCVSQPNARIARACVCGQAHARTFGVFQNTPQSHPVGMASADATARDLESDYEGDLTDNLAYHMDSDEEEIRQSILLKAAFEANEDEDSEKLMRVDDDDSGDTDYPCDGVVEDGVEDGVGVAASADVEMHLVQREVVDNTTVAARNGESTAGSVEKQEDSVPGSDRARALKCASAGCYTMCPRFV